MVVVLEGGTEDKILLVYTVATYILLVIVRVTIINFKFSHNSLHNIILLFYYYYYITTITIRWEGAGGIVAVSCLLPDDSSARSQWTEGGAVCKKRCRSLHCSSSQKQLPDPSCLSSIHVKLR